jgi:hypothetical protein
MVPIADPADFHFHFPLHVGDGYLNRWPPNVFSPRVHKSASSRVSQVTIIEASERGRDGRLLASTPSDVGPSLFMMGTTPQEHCKYSFLAELEAINAVCRNNAARVQEGHYCPVKSYLSRWCVYIYIYITYDNFGLKNRHQRWNWNFYKFKINWTSFC